MEWLPISGWGNTPGDKILPTITLGLGYAAFISRLSRGGILEVMSKDYIRTARAKGLPARVIVFKHALRGGLIPVVAFLGPAFAGLLSGSFVVETIFQIPGLTPKKTAKSIAYSANSAVTGNPASISSFTVLPG